MALQYGSFHRTPDRRGLRSLLRLVAVGGTLVVVGHDTVAHGLADPGAQTRMYDPESYVGVTELAPAIEDSEPWWIEVHETRLRPDGTKNPHLWYDPKTMPAVAKKIAEDLESLDPSHKAAFEKNLITFDDSLTTWKNQLASFKTDYSDTPVAVTEPVADYALQAAGVDIKTPWSLQAAIMNDTDPSPQQSAAQDALFTGGQVKAFLYNQQVTDSITSHYLSLAHKNDVPVVGVYETMPTEIIGALAERAQRQGALRPDVTSVDIAMLMCTPAHIASAIPGSHLDLWTRYLTIILDGLAAEGASALEVPPPPVLT